MRNLNISQSEAVNTSQTSPMFSAQAFCQILDPMLRVRGESPNCWFEVDLHIRVKFF